VEVSRRDYLEMALVNMSVFLLVRRSEVVFSSDDSARCIYEMVAVNPVQNEQTL